METQAIKILRNSEEDIYTLKTIDVEVDGKKITMEFKVWDNGDVDDIEPSQTENIIMFYELDDDTQQEVYDTIIEEYAP